MPSTVVHLALGALVGVALLGDEFDRRALAVVLVAAATPDLDTFFGFVLVGAHRSLLHTLLLPTLLGGGLVYDTRLRGGSRLRDRFGGRGVRLGWAALAALAFGGIFPDLFTNGINAFYPLYDGFYSINGHLYLSNQRGVVQTFVEFAPEEPRATTETRHYRTGVDPSPGAEPENVERVFPVVSSGTQLMLVLVSAVVVGARLRENGRVRASDEPPASNH
ncbi:MULTISPECIES: metal-dependent hydrolase [Haloprofundus]|uniref:metal-dependent hydrolase n=1 Tax=Haloprofundus TaxID=1911573 RepID=UPI000E44A3AB|nr:MULTISPECIES: metal-dependent hydrolase [Haloprofundus]QCJ46382.1 metal-dependent hydrolase [Haloprofundus sp. MHR1]